MHTLQIRRGDASTGWTRARELEIGALVERAARAGIEGVVGARFLAGRAMASVAALEPSSAKQALSRAVEALAAEPVDRGDLCRALVSYGGVLEQHRQHGEAAEAYEAALAVQPDSEEQMLHAARAHRKAGNRERALELYRLVRERGEGRLALFSALGEALLDASPEPALDRVLAEAESQGDGEAAGVALEERARLRRRQGRTAEVVSDLTEAGRRYEERQDRVRVAHALADALLAVGDLPGARESLSLAASLARPEESAYVVQRLRLVAREQGDELGLRRWPPVGSSPLVGLMPRRSAASACAQTFADRVRDWRDALETA